MATDSDDEAPQLSAHSLAALREFYDEREERQRLFEASFATGAGGEGGVAIEEDWKLSQFWYEDKTALTLAQEALDAGNRIVCISCPTLYAKLLQIKPAECEIFLLEYDRRFEIYGENFVFYDYSRPLDLPEELGEKSFDIVVADPPYLSEECLRKMAQTVSFLTERRIILCTGVVMEGLVNQLLTLKMCSFLPQHTRNLANDFRCFVNYDSKMLNSD